MPASKGSLVVRRVVLANNTEVKRYPDDVTGLTADAARTSARGLTIHSRTAFDLFISFASGDDAAGDFITLEASLYLTVSADEEIRRIYFKTADVAGTTVELMLSDTLILLSVGPS